jgi:hypothetical protein
MTRRTQAASAAIFSRTHRRTALAAAALGLALATSAQAAVFTNGSFELPGGAPIKQELSEGSTFVTGWTSHGAGNYYESDGQDGLNAVDGDYWIGFGHNGNHGGSITQTFTSLLGASYTLDFQFALQQGSDLSSAFHVSASTGDGVDSPDAVFGSWSSGSLTFLGTGSDVTLTFLDITAPNSGGVSNLALDNVRLNHTGPVIVDPVGGVPEPAAWAMMLMGFGGIGALIRRRKLQAA